MTSLFTNSVLLIVSGELVLVMDDQPSNTKLSFRIVYLLSQNLFSAQIFNYFHSIFWIVSVYYFYSLFLEQGGYETVAHPEYVPSIVTEQTEISRPSVAHTSCSIATFLLALRTLLTDFPLTTTWKMYLGIKIYLLQEKKLNDTLIELD